MQAAVEMPRVHDLPQPGRRELAHIPGPRFGSRLVNTLAILADPIGITRRAVESYGLVFKSNSFHAWNVQLIGPDANELVLSNRERIFSSELGWNPLLERVFPRGLMLLDGERHQLDRRALGVAFRAESMQRYLAAMNEGIARSVATWDTSGEVALYPAMKQLTLDLAAGSFFGIAWGPEADRLNRAFMDMVLASVGIVRRPLPGTAMARGVRAREVVSEFVHREIARRRGAEGDDIFTQLCNLDGDAPPLSAQAIVDHMNFLMLAAHDTLTSSLTAAVYFLGRHPIWQSHLQEEIDALRASDGPALRYDRLDRLPRTEMVFKEALRLVPPVPGIPRRALAAFEHRGFHIPAGTPVGVSPLHTHRMPDLWPDPARFDPLRFSPEASRGRHRFAWVPFGGGAHMCLGMHFAHVQAKAFLFHLLGTRRIALEPGYETSFRMFPIPRPKDGLRVRLPARA